jgi:hypothetical protein
LVVYVAAGMLDLLAVTERLPDDIESAHEEPAA